MTNYQYLARATSPTLYHTGPDLDLGWYHTLSMPPTSKKSNLETQASLDTYIKNSPLPQDVSPLVTSQEVRDRGSIFIANLFPATSPNEARTRIAHLKNVMHNSKPATHEIAAWRCMVLKPGHSGFGGPNDFELNAEYSDDGEKWAGAKIQKVMELYAIIDAVVIVSRWCVFYYLGTITLTLRLRDRYGGTMLGPARFSHIETCAAEVCQEFRRSEDLRECISDLMTLDAVLAGLRVEYNEASGGRTGTIGNVTPTPKDYAGLDFEKGKRLIKARENAIKSVKLLLARRRDTTQNATAGSGDHS
ncbi:hypothetical protein H0H87_008266 [Tephrocybe sp. NHM501043]|nr:hypothetical protein H0H87_008266 [Tephrocybe sp. NHM501043]